MKSSEIKVLKSKYKVIECTDGNPNDSNIIYAPYIPICTKVTVCGPNGTKTIWQIGYWERFILFVNKMFHKKRKIRNL